MPLFRGCDARDRLTEIGTQLVTLGLHVQKDEPLDQENIPNGIFSYSSHL